MNVICSTRRKIRFQKLPLILSKRGYTLILTLFTTIIEFSTIVTVSFYNFHFNYYKFRDKFLLYLCSKKYTYRSILLKVSFFLNNKYETLLYFMAKTGKTWYSNTEIVKVFIFNSKFSMIYGKNYDVWNAHARRRAAKTQTLRSLLISVLSSSPICRLCRSHIICFAS